MTDSWKTNKETKRDDSGDRVSRFFVLRKDHKIIMKKFALMILVIGLVGVFSGCAGGQTLRDARDAYNRLEDARDAYFRKDYRRVFEILKPLAEQGNVDAQYNLGVMYANTEAVKWWKLAAEQGLAIAQYNLGYMYLNGKGVPQDYKEAIKWYRLSAEQGDANAQYDLGLMYEDGNGVLKDHTQAYKWYNIAGANGHEGARDIRDRLEKEMTPFEREEGQRLAKEWIKEHRSGQQTQIAESPPQPSPPPRTSPPSTPQPPKSEGGGIATGSGFLFGSQDYIITNYHVVKGTSELKVKFVNEEIIDARVVARDTQNDVAILKLNKSPSFQTREMKFGDSSMVRMGDKVFTIGYPSIKIMGFRPKYTEGVISAVTGIKDDPTVFQTSVPIQPGNSGGPLFNEKGEVIGLTTASLSLSAIESLGAVPQNVNYAIKSSFVKNVIGTVPESLISNRGIVIVPTESNSRADFIEKIKKNVVLILGKVD